MRAALHLTQSELTNLQARVAGHDAGIGKMCAPMGLLVSCKPRWALMCSDELAGLQQAQVSIHVHIRLEELKMG